MAEFEYMDHRVLVQFDTRCVLCCLVTLNHPGAVIASRERTHDANRLRLIIRLNQDGKARSAKIALYSRLPALVGHFHMVTQHPRIGLWALFLDRGQSSLHIGGITHLLRLKTGDLALLLPLLHPQLLMAVAALCMQLLQAVTTAVSTVFLSAPILQQGILRPLNADCLVETVFKGAKIPREVFLQ